MRDEQIDDVLRRAAEAQPPVDPALLDRVVSRIGPDLKPIVPLPPVGRLVAGLLAISAAVTLLGAARAGFTGVATLTLFHTLILCLPLALLLWLAAAGFAGEMIPGSRRRVSSPVLTGLATATLLSVYLFVFRDYGTERFLRQGAVCIAAGLMHAIPTALACWWLLKRGFAVNPSMAGLAVGTLAGLTGVTMLELHCVDFQAPHRLVWHASVLPLSALAGWCVLRLRQRE